MKNHKYISLVKVVTAMMDGQVFWFGGDKIHFDSSRSKPFRCNNTDLSCFWADWKDWKIKSHWTDDLSEKNPVLCWVQNVNKSTQIIKRICEVVGVEFIDTAGLTWVYAEPVKPEECWQGDE